MTDAGSELNESTIAPAGAVPTVSIDRGTCWALFAYEVGFAIDLDEAQRRITANKERASIRHKRRAPYYFEYQPAPLRIMQDIVPIEVGKHRTGAMVEAVIYDFGAVSVQYSIPLKGPLSSLRGLSNKLYDHAPLQAASRKVVEVLVRSIEPAVTRPAIRELVEDYAIYQIETLTPERDPSEVIAEQGLLLAQILRAETVALSGQEVDEALSHQMSFGRDDQTLIDWNAALLFDRDADDVRAVLEFANVELLEMRYLDDRLDDALEQAYAAATKPFGLLRAFRASKSADLQHVADLQMDSAVMYESVNNALKLLGDQYLARVHRLVSQRFHLNGWNASIRRKVETLESIYDKISDRHANRRIEVLEWIIIILIAIEIVMSLVERIVGA